MRVKVQTRVRVRVRVLARSDLVKRVDAPRLLGVGVDLAPGLEARARDRGRLSASVRGTR